MTVRFNLENSKFKTDFVRRRYTTTVNDYGRTTVVTASTNCVDVIVLIDTGQLRQSVSYVVRAK